MPIYIYFCICISTGLINDEKGMTIYYKAYALEANVETQHGIFIHL